MSRAKFLTNSCQHCAHAQHCLLPQKHFQAAALDAFQFSARLLKRGEHLCRQGQSSDTLYILRAGILKSYITKQNGEEFIMGFYFPPDLFGWEHMDKTQHSISIVALDQSNVCAIPTDKMMALTHEIPTLGTQLLRMVGRRIEQDNIALLRTTAHQRVATFLLQLTYRYHQMGFPDHYCQLLMTHQDIANYLRITPSTISRIFHEWQHKKIIRMEKHIVYLLDFPMMRMMSELEG